MRDSRAHRVELVSLLLAWGKFIEFIKIIVRHWMPPEGCWLLDEELWM